MQVWLTPVRPVPALLGCQQHQGQQLRHLNPTPELSLIPHPLGLHADPFTFGTEVHFLAFGSTAPLEHPGCALNRV